MKISHLLILLIPFYLVRFQLFSIPTTLFEIILYFVFLYFLLSKEIKVNNIPKVILFGILLWLIGSAIGVYLAENKIQALGIFKGYILDPIILLFVLLIDAKSSRQDTKTFVLQSMKSLVVIAGLISLASLIAYFAGQGVAKDFRLLGIYALDPGASPNYLALFLAPILPLNIYLFLIAQDKFDKLYLLMVLTLSFLGLFLTRSRAGLASGIFGMLFLAIYYLKAKKTISLSIFKTALIVLWVGALSGLIFFSKGNLSPEMKSGRVASSNNIRLEIWKTTLMEIIPSSPIFGVGLGNYQNYFTNLTKGRPNFGEYIAPLAVTPHNLFLSVWVNLSLFGLAGLLLMIYGFIRMVHKAKHLQTIALTSSFSVIILHGMVDTPILKNDLGVLFFLIIGLGILAQFVNDKN